MRYKNEALYDELVFILDHQITLNRFEEDIHIRKNDSDRIKAIIKLLTET